jgi:hypothetical protein
VVHEQCARVLDVGETEEGLVYLAMELAEGETLDMWVRDAPMPTLVAIDVLTQVASALVAIHAAGLVHRDLSSRNVMIALRNGAPVVKVLDFGIAQSVALAKGNEERSGADGGFANPVFSAPEHLAGQDVDSRADVYSFGVVAYQVLTGRLPIEHADARSAARATIAGELQPLGALPGVPRRLQRLVQVCLSRDRKQRPQTAVALLAELAAFAPSRSVWLPRLSVAAFAIAVVAALLTFGRTIPPFLRLMDDKLTLLDGTLTPSTPVQYLRTGDVAKLRGNFGGFAAEQLVVEVWRSGQVLGRHPLQPAVDSAGSLVLSDLQPSWEQVVDRLRTSSREGPVDLLFVLPGLAVLGDARVQLDDAPPDLRIDVDGGSVDGRALLHKAVLRWQVEDQTGLQEFQVRTRLADDRVAAKSLPLKTGTGDLQLGEELAAIWTSCAPMGAGEVVVVAVDRAGNRATSVPIAFDQVDVAVPRVELVTGTGGEPVIPWIGARAGIQVRLSCTEPGLRFSVLDPQGEERLPGSLIVPDALGLCRMELRAADPSKSEDPFPVGTYRFQVADPAGNRSEAALALQFRSRSIDGQIREGGTGAIRLGDEWALAPNTVLGLAFGCNASFLPVRAELTKAGGGELAAGLEAQLSNPAKGKARVDLPALPPGNYELAIDVTEPGIEGARAQRWTQRLCVLPPVVTLQLPDARARFLEPLRQQGLFTLDGDTLRDGAFRVEGELQRCLRGALWLGSDLAQLTVQPLPDQSRGNASLLPPVRVRAGRNVLAFELRDVLGRPVRLLFGETPASLLRIGEHELSLLADFHHDTSPPQLVGEEVRVEFEQPVRLRVRSSLPFVEADRNAIRLALGTGEWSATAVRTVEAGTELEFALPFQACMDAAGLEPKSREQFAAGVAASIDATLRSPAGQAALRLPLRTARTTLRIVRLGELASGLAPALAGIELVPVLAPAAGVFADPVPADAEGRALFRPQPLLDVRNFPDVFVQRDEFTLAQYAEVLALLPRDGADGSLLHADDPLGNARLELANMVPLPWRTDPSGFAAVAAQQPAAAVRGLDFFQAYTATRLVAKRVADDAELLRLPLGCELELAAFGAARPVRARNGAAAQGQGVAVDRWRAAGALDALRPGLSAQQLALCGDSVPSPFGGSFTGLDFGCREWVLDLPWGSDPQLEFALPEWSSDHGTLAARASQFARGVPPPANLQARLRTFGVVRGLPMGASYGLLDANGAPLRDMEAPRLPATVPGVVRSEQLRRDGRDLTPGAVDPRILQTGFRLAGSQAFVQRVRGT